MVSYVGPQQAGVQVTKIAKMDEPEENPWDFRSKQNRQLIIQDVVNRFYFQLCNSIKFPSGSLA